MRTRPAPALLLVAALASCSRPAPSPEYQEAARHFREVVGRHPLDAYASPEMDQVLALLERVPGSSADAEAAAALRQKITAERQALVEETARRARLVEAAGVPPPPVAFPAPTGGEGAAPAAAPAAQELAAGTTLEQFRKEHGKCFAARSPAILGRTGGKPVLGEAWALRDDPECKEAYAGLAGKLVLFSEGKLVDVRAAAEAKETPIVERVEGIRMPDGSMAVKGPDGKPRPLPPGAAVKWEEPAAARPAGAAAPASGQPPAGGGGAVPAPIGSR